MRGALVVVAGALLLSVTGVAHQAGSRAPAAWPVGMIRADAMVEDAGGASVSGLTRDDFEILTDGQPRPIEFFSSGAAPLTVAVLVDVTASMDQGSAGVAGLPSSAGTTTVGRGMPSVPGNRIALAVEEFALKGIRPDDRVRLGAIGRRLFLSERFTSDARERAKAWQALFGLPPIEWLGPSPIWDALAEATTLMSGEPGHRAIVLLSDGMASGNVRSYREVAEHAALAGVSISSAGEAGGVAQGLDPGQTLRAIADATGGVHVPVPHRLEGDAFVNRSKSIEHILDRLHGAYVLGFMPAIVDGKVHTLEVRVNKPGVNVKARKAYVAATVRSADRTSAAFTTSKCAAGPNLRQRARIMGARACR